jgi:prepilin-type N-terminal cleavage/methylation domain
MPLRFSDADARVRATAVSKRSAARPRAGFTLIELLVVIAIIAILAAILFPVFAQARDKARQTACLSNMKQIGLGFMMYVQDFDETFPGCLLCVPTINGGSTSDTRMPFDRQIFPYTKSDEIFACPSDHEVRVPPTDSRIQFWDGSYRAKGLIRSYSYVATIDTAQANGRDANTGMSTYTGNVGINGTPPTARSLSQIDEPSSTIVVVENWPKDESDWANSAYVGSSHGSGFVGCDLWKLAGRIPGVSDLTSPDSLPNSCSGNRNKLPTVGHASGTGSNYVMSDGSAKFRTYRQVRANDFYLFKLKKPATTVTP